MIDWTKFKSAAPTFKPNKMLIPVNRLDFNDEDVKTFNEIYQYCLEAEKLHDMKKFVETPSHGISIKRENLYGSRFMITQTTSTVEIVIRNLDARYYRFICGQGKVKEGEYMSGRQAFQIYKKELAYDKINIDDLAIENGKEIKETIPSPRIDLLVPAERTYIHANHLDINSAYNAGMMEAFPILSTTIRRMYSLRKALPEYKNVLNMTQGFMQSALVGYKFSHISKAGYEYTIRKIDELSEALINDNFRVLAYNTDGIWYQSLDGTNRAYHGPGEGIDIGQWKNDHIDCKLRFKSKGAYEFIDNTGKYKPVVRGLTTLDKLKDRDSWEWGDIFNCVIFKYAFREGYGLYKVDEFDREI